MSADREAVLREALAKVLCELDAFATSDSSDREWPDYVWRVTGALRGFLRAALKVAGASEASAPPGAPARPEPKEAPLRDAMITVRHESANSTSQDHGAGYPSLGAAPPGASEAPRDAVLRAFVTWAHEHAATIIVKHPGGGSTLALLVDDFLRTQPSEAAPPGPYEVLDRGGGYSSWWGVYREGDDYFFSVNKRESEAVRDALNRCVAQQGGGA